MRRSFALVALAAVPCAQGRVWVVDGSGGGDFLDLPPAVAAAAPGDTLLVRSGTGYTGPAVNGPLTIVADAGATVMVTGLWVAGLGPAESVVLRGMVLFGPVELRGNAGAVWLEDCTVVGLGVGLEVVDCDSVVLLRVRVRALDTAPLVVRRSNLTAHESSSRAPPSPRGPGLPGALIEDARVLLAASEVRGGRGSDGAGAEGRCEADGANGGPGIEFVGEPSTVRCMGCAIEGGAGGGDGGDESGCSSGTHGPQATGPGFVHEVVPDPRIEYAASSPVAAGDAALAELRGPPGAVVVVAVGTRPAGALGSATFPPWLKLAPLVAPPASVVVGVLDGSGALALSLAVGRPPHGAASATRYTQAAVVVAGALVTGGASAVTLLEAP